MNMLEQRFMETVPSLLKEIAHQIKISNMLKAVEMNQRASSDTMKKVNDIMETI